MPDSARLNLRMQSMQATATKLAAALKGMEEAPNKNIRGIFWDEAQTCMSHLNLQEELVGESLEME